MRIILKLLEVKMKKRCLFYSIVIISIFMATAVRAEEEITGVRIHAVSSEQPEWSLSASNIVSGVGIGVPDGNTFTSDYTKMWCSASWVWEEPSVEWIEFDLGRMVELSEVKIWNYNQPGFTGRGVFQFRMGLSTDGVNWNYDEGFFQLTEGPGDDVTPFADLFDIYTEGYFRYVRFDSMYITYGPEYIGLSQVKFYGTPSPNGAPTVDAGPSQTIKSGTNATMDVNAQDDGQPVALTYTWTQESGPASASFSPNANVENPVISLPSAGIYCFKITIYDGEFYASDTVYVNVIPANWNTIDGIIISEYSSLYNWFRHPSFTVNGFGLFEISENCFGHISTTGDVAMWSSPYMTDVAGQYLVVDLGDQYVLNNFRLWNFNESWANNKAMGVGDFELLASATDPNVSSGGTSLGTFTAAIAPGTQVYDYSQVFPISNTNLFRYVRLNVISNLGFEDEWGKTVGIAEMMFSGYKNGCTTQLAGDLDGNCKVDFADFAQLADNWLEDTSL